GPSDARGEAGPATAVCPGAKAEVRGGQPLALHGSRTRAVGYLGDCGSVLLISSSWPRSGHLTCSSTRRLPLRTSGTTLGEMGIVSVPVTAVGEKNLSIQAAVALGSVKERYHRARPGFSSLFWPAPAACNRLVLLSVFTSRR